MTIPLPIFRDTTLKTNHMHGQLINFPLFIQLFYLPYCNITSLPTLKIILPLLFINCCFCKIKLYLCLDKNCSSQKCTCQTGCYCPDTTYRSMQIIVYLAFRNICTCKRSQICKSYTDAQLSLIFVFILVYL